MSGGITDVEGVLVGHWTDERAATGCTVVLLPPGTTVGCCIPGGAPATRETALLAPSSLVREVHAIVLSGGSAFGLAAADGVMRFLEERGTGYATPAGVVPIVPAACLYDLAIGDPRRRPGPDEGRAACEAAGREVAEGSVGAGTGATVAKLLGPHAAVKGGLGTASTRAAGATVGALVACNAVGDVIDATGAPIAKPRADGSGHPGGSTVLVAVATDATLDKAAAGHLATMAAAGIARAVRPAHTHFDGDIVFVAATNRVAADPLAVGAAAADVVAEALRRGVLRARGIAGVPGLAG